MWSVKTLWGKEKEMKYQRSSHPYEKPSFRDSSKPFEDDRILDSSKLEEVANISMWVKLKEKIVDLDLHGKIHCVKKELVVTISFFFSHFFFHIINLRVVKTRNWEGVNILFFLVDRSVQYWMPFIRPATMNKKLIKIVA